jgi:hypothetical protein
MSTYHQMGHDSQNLLGAVDGFSGAILSPVNEVEDDVIGMVKQHASDSFEFVFDPQLYFPRRGDKGKLSTWSYFPQDFETGDMTSPGWWDGVISGVVDAAARVGAKAVCSPATLSGATATNEYYEFMRNLADRTAEAATKNGLLALQTVAVKLPDLTSTERVMEIASIVSGAKTSGVYLLFLSDVKPREELRDVDELKGAMKLIRTLEDADIRVLVGCSSSDVVLWKAAGATSCATGKFANLRRFTAGRFSEQEDGGRQMAYWFEEPLLAFIRGSDIARLQTLGLAAAGNNPFSAQILDQIAKDPGKPWVGLGWRQYMWWFADVEKRLAASATNSVGLIRAAEKNWIRLEDAKPPVFMEESRNDGEWLRPWLRASVEFNA